MKKKQEVRKVEEKERVEKGRNRKIKSEEYVKYKEKN
jgi:hypothetical protein